MRLVFSSFSIFFVILAIITNVTAQESKGKEEAKTSSPTANTTDDQPDFFYFGAGSDGKGRSMVGNDAMISRAMKWGQKFWIDQLLDRPAEFIPSSAFQIPSTSDYNNRKYIGAGADYMLSCYNDELFNTQHQLNLQCSKKPTCAVSYFVTSIWGTLGKMNWEKDGVVLRSCAILEVGGKNCNFPDSPTCTMKLYKDWTQKADQESVNADQILQSGPITSIDQAPKILEALSQKTKKPITLPNGNLTGSKK